MLNKPQFSHERAFLGHFLFLSCVALDPQSINESRVELTPKFYEQTIHKFWTNNHQEFCYKKRLKFNKFYKSSLYFCTFFKVHYSQLKSGKMGKLDGKVAIITGMGVFWSFDIFLGSSAGIGKTTAALFAQEGASVTIHGRSSESIKKTFELLKSNGVPENKILTVQGQIENEQTCHDLINKTVQKFGKLDILVNFFWNKPKFFYKQIDRSTTLESVQKLGLILSQWRILTIFLMSTSRGK